MLAIVLVCALTGLPERIDGIESVRFGSSSSPEGLEQGYDYAFLITFTDEHARDRYLPHPDTPRSARWRGPSRNKFWCSTSRRRRRLRHHPASSTRSRGQWPVLRWSCSVSANPRISRAVPKDRRRCMQANAQVPSGTAAQRVELIFSVAHASVDERLRSRPAIHVPSGVEAIADQRRRPEDQAQLHITGP